MVFKILNAFRHSLLFFRTKFFIFYLTDDCENDDPFEDDPSDNPDGRSPEKKVNFIIFK
jgi:hypothetical protein